MNKLKDSKSIWLPVLVMILIVAVFSIAYLAQEGDRMMSSADKVQDIFRNPRSLCFGRFLVDVPSDVIVTYGPVQIDGDIEVYPDSVDKISDLLTEKLQEVENRKTDFPEYTLLEFPLVGKTFDGILPGQKILFGIEDSISYDIYSYIPLNKDLIIYNTNALPQIDEIPSINKIATALRYRPKDEIPAGPGIW